MAVPRACARLRALVIGLTAATLALASSPGLQAEARGPGAKHVHGRTVTRHLHHQATLSSLPPMRRSEPIVKPRQARPAKHAAPAARRHAPSVTPASLSRRLEVPAVHAAAPAAAAVPSQVTEFTAATNDGSTPPDTSIAVGPSDVMEIVNSTWHRFDRNGHQTDSGNTSDLFGAPENSMIKNASYGDGRVEYDGLSGRFLASILIFDASNGDSEVVVGASTSNRPDAWNFYTIDDSTDGTLLDQPKLGFSSDKIVMTYNLHGEDGPFRSVTIQKQDVVDGADSAGVTVFPDDGAHFNVIPAISLSATNTLFGLSANRGGSTLTVFEFTGTPNNGDAAFDTTDFPIATLNDPPGADQQNDARTIDTGPSGIQSAVWQQGVLTGAADDSCTPPGDTVARSCVRIESVNTADGLTPFNDRDIGETNGHFYYPAVTFDSSGNLWIGITASSTTNFATAAELFVPGGFVPDETGGIEFAAGVAPYDCTFCVAPGDTRNRWGDYSAAVQDPANPAHVWLGEEFGAFDMASSNDWGTAIAEFTPS